MRTRTAIVALVGLCVAGGLAYYYRERIPFLADRFGGRTDTTASAPAKPAGERAVAVASFVARSEIFPIRRRTIGIVESPASVLVKSRIDSQIMTQHVTDGQMVNAGDLLFTLDDREIRAAVAKDEATLARDKALRDRANADLARQQELLARNAAAQSRLDQAIADAKSAEATVAADEAVVATNRLKLSYTQIKAPMSGRLGAVRIAPGNLVRANETSSEQGLVTITQVKPIRVAFTLPERELPLVRAAMLRKPPPPVRVYLPGTNDELAAGTIDFLDNQVDTGSGTIIAKANFPNDDLRLWPGMFVDVVVDLDMRPDTVTVPTPAVQVGQRGNYVFAIKPDKTVEARDVTVIGTEGGRTAIASGLDAGEHVVIEGQLRVAPGTLVRESVRGADPGTPASPADADRLRQRRDRS